MGAFDDAWGEQGGAPAAPTNFDAAWDSAAVAPIAPVSGSDWMNELLAVRNRGVEGLAGVIQIADAVNRNLNPIFPGGPRAFGLNETLFNTPRTELSEDIKKGAKYIGVYGPEKAKTEIGKMGENVSMNAAGAAPFGPLAMLASAIFGGSGGYAGEKTAEYMGLSPESGRAVGSFLGGISPQGIRKLGIVKELGEQLGPTVSQLPVLRDIFGTAPVEAAVGRALTKSAEDAPAAEVALRESVNTMGPPTELQSLRTTSEIAGDRGLARATDATQSAIPGAPFEGIAQERAAIRARVVLRNYDPSQTAYETSKGLEQKISNSAHSIEAVEDATWGALDKGALVDTRLSGLDDSLGAEISTITHEGALPLEGEAAALLRRFHTAQSATDEGVVNIGTLQRLRSGALQVMRDTSAGLNVADRTANRVASVIESHLRNIVDTNIEHNVLPEDVAAIWRGARQVTRDKFQTFSAPKPGLENRGTKSLEQVALRGQPLDNTTLLREGLNSPDKMAAHLQAGAAGGEDVRPLYQQALKSELDGTAQRDWADIINRRRTQWEMVFTPEEMRNIDNNLSDIESQLGNARASVTTGSQTNPRGNVQRVLNSEKGIANLSSVTSSAPALIGGAAGAKYGWDKSKTTAGGIANALLYGTIGAFGGKAISSSAARASDVYDNLLTESLRVPSKGLAAIEAAKPSNFSRQAGQAFLDTAKASAIKEIDRQVKRAVSDVFKSKTEDTGQNPPKAEETNIDSLFKKEEPDMESSAPVKQDVAQVEQQIDQDPYYSTLYEVESGRNPNAKNPESSASGAFQLINSTAKSLGVKDRFDIAESFDAIQRLTDENRARFGDDPELLYSAHYLGATVLQKVIDGEPLTEAEQKQVSALKNIILPRFRRIYETKTTEV